MKSMVKVYKDKPCIDSSFLYYVLELCTKDLLGPMNFKMAKKIQDLNEFPCEILKIVVREDGAVV